MKTILALAALCLALAVANALTITEAEYFVNADPGAGFGSPISITPGESVSIPALFVPTNSLTAHLSHRLYLRFRSEEGIWGAPQMQNFFILNPAYTLGFQPDVVGLEYQIDALTPVQVDLPDWIYAEWTALIPTTGLSLHASHKLTVRFIDERGLKSNPEARYFFLHDDGGSYSVHNITHLEYHFDADTSVLVDLADGTFENWISLIPTVGLAFNRSHKLTIRHLDDRGLWSNPEARYFFLHQETGGNYTVHNITALKYTFDSDTVNAIVDLTDGTFQSWTSLVPTDFLSLNQSRKFTVRYRDDRGLWSNPEARYFFIHSSDTTTEGSRIITQLRYWIDEDSPTVEDVPDSIEVGWSDLIPHNAGPGNHRFYIQYGDEQGRWGPTESRPFFVWTGVGPRGNARLAGAEYWVNVDPGVGNGVAIDFPGDGIWDEQDEEALTVLTGIPTGLHVFGLRFRDELGDWSVTLIDSFIVGPVLVIKRQANNIVLNWIANPDNTPFTVYRGDASTGPFNQIAQTNDLTYTDVGVISASEKYFYYITSTGSSLTSFRLPAALDKPIPLDR